ncbi:MAG TPA: ATP-binding protein [Thermodesulfovibrionales bacterium]|nr:ATP-binding protein [Thermodesulfovibrionales bacterium]
MKTRAISGAAKVAIIYFLVSVLYIYFSDRLLKAVVEDADMLTLIQTYKGMIFVAFSSVLIYSLVRKSQRENEKILRQLDAKVRERTAEFEDAMLLAQSTNRTKSEFLANMSHELRTPLNAIIGFSEAMLSGIYGPINEKHREYLNDIMLSGENLLRLINDILDLSKIEAGSLNVDLREFSLNELIKSAAGMFREKTVKHGIGMKYHVEDGLDEIVADQRKLKQVVVNLLSNAIKFTPEGGWITVDVRKEGTPGVAGGVVREPGLPNSNPGGFIEISVEDTGIGIAKDDIPKLFQAFQQLESPFQKRYGGTGLGLFLTKRLVELHGGSIRVESEKSKGTRVTVSIPVKGSV